MTQYPECLLNREAQYAAFSNGPLLHFWRRRDEGEFIGVDRVPIRFARFASPSHHQVVMLLTGRTDSYVKYSEVAYDLFHNGYDVLMMDHRGQGRSGRLLKDTHRGHVENFSDYVDDVAQFWQLQLAKSGYKRRFALAHSMGGVILADFLARRPEAFDAAALCAPMCDIHLPMPEWLAWRILDRTERYPKLRDYYAIGASQWQPLPFVLNVLTHSRARHLRSMRIYADDPSLRIGGPTYHWVREALLAGRDLMSRAAKMTVPLLVLQAEDDRVVDNRGQDAFCKAMAVAGHPVAGGKPQVIRGARHDMLFEEDTVRADVLRRILHHFAQYH
ncbi:lysophospholipase L2 [Lonsdalea quercina]|uniref:lysophospholipase L2 n=1 Tax=Lonsdalea quercina TaxID=71657 RepID=UPI0039770ABF